MDVSLCVTLPPPLPFCCSASSSNQLSDLSWSCFLFISSSFLLWPSVARFLPHNIVNGSHATRSRVFVRLFIRLFGWLVWFGLVWGRILLQSLLAWNPLLTAGCRSELRMTLNPCQNSTSGLLSRGPVHILLALNLNMFVGWYYAGQGCWTQPIVESSKFSTPKLMPYLNTNEFHVCSWVSSPWYLTT